MSNLFDQRPKVSPNAFVAPSATVVGEVELWDKVSVWYGAVIRGTYTWVFFWVWGLGFEVWARGLIFVERRSVVLVHICMYVHMCVSSQVTSRPACNPPTHTHRQTQPSTPTNAGDRNKVKIGAVTNVQDHAVISTVAALETGFPAKVEIGNQVTIGAWTGLGFKMGWMEGSMGCLVLYHQPTTTNSNLNEPVTPQTAPQATAPPSPPRRSRTRP